MYGVVGTDGVVYGPVPVTTLFEWVAAGRVVPATVLIDGQGRRLSASMLPELQGAFVTSFYPRPALVQTFDPTLKRKRTALLFAFFLGFAGAHRFYLGHRATGWAMLLLNLAACGFGLRMGIAIEVVATVWLVVDMATIANGSLREANGRPLV